MLHHLTHGFFLLLLLDVQVLVLEYERIISDVVGELDRFKLIELISNQFAEVLRLWMLVDAVEGVFPDLIDAFLVQVRQLVGAGAATIAVDIPAEGFDLRSAH